MTTRVDTALRSALADVNRAYVRLPINLRDRLDVSSNAPDEAVNAALRSGDQDAALVAIRAWRDGHLAAIREAGRSTRCRCDAPISSTDEHGDTRCVRCGRETA